MNNTKTWLEYYLPLVNNKEKEEKFYNKYKEFLYFITKIINENKSINTLVEEGCGTAIITKLLNNKNPLCFDKLSKVLLSDISYEMLQLARINLENCNIYTDIQTINNNILSPYTILDDKMSRKYTDNILYTDIVITHGVLEHFEKSLITSILNKYNNSNRVKAHVHYVPLDEYKEKSFGDENLMSMKEWLGIINSSNIQEFNTIIIKNGPDLYFAVIK